ncbi:MAG: hypothetical protein CL454_05285 [Acidimicrobiaceae bacterium]|nr:MAG: hypothetical protein MB53_00795 [marine actinobacterium MedAcidi-G2A]MBC84253.1 hypothetical protein [Acidimicrobiaceae bacterium]OUV00710.1 MAG: hypothetical protein CBC37_03865 [Acidimicrobiaceae bacterium TMED77]
MLAIEYAEGFSISPNELTDEFFKNLNSHFTSREIVELSGYIAFCLGIGRVYKVLDIANECPVVH